MLENNLTVSHFLNFLFITMPTYVFYTICARRLKNFVNHVILPKGTTKVLKIHYVSIQSKSVIIVPFNLIMLFGIIRTKHPNILNIFCTFIDSIYLTIWFYVSTKNSPHLFKLLIATRKFVKDYSVRFFKLSIRMKYIVIFKD